MKYLLDTNVFREIGKTRPHRNVAAWLASVADTDLAMSALMVREVTKGIARLRESKIGIAQAIQQRISAVLEDFADRILPIDRAVAATWGELLAASEKHFDDTGLAATARVHGLILVTRNTRHLAGRGVMLIDPFKARSGQPSR
jgi:predicted nucleic acid-binding protein